MRAREADIVRSATRNTLKPAAVPRDAARRGPPRHAGRDAAVEREQERLWAACIAEQPDIISDIVNFIEAARTRLVESPPVAPTDDEGKSQPRRETKSGTGERPDRK